jgi:DNA-directed RNA polymerase subunit M/transcription elongation factor TFIIS
MYPTIRTPDPATIFDYVFNERRNTFVPVRMPRVKCPECGADFESMVWYNANKRNPSDPLWVVECDCGEQFTSNDPNS